MKPSRWYCSIWAVVSFFGMARAYIAVQPPSTHSKSDPAARRGGIETGPRSRIRGEAVLGARDALVGRTGRRAGRAADATARARGRHLVVDAGAEADQRRGEQERSQDELLVHLESLSPIVAGCFT